MAAPAKKAAKKPAAKKRAASPEPVSGDVAAPDVPDLSEMQAARVGDRVVGFRFAGEFFPAPVELPAAAVPAVAEHQRQSMVTVRALASVLQGQDVPEDYDDSALLDALERALVELIGRDEYDRFLALGPSQNTVGDALTALLKQYGFTMGESSASSPS